MEWQGLPITRDERIIRDKAKKDMRGRMCLVLQRLADGRYLICYLTSFGQRKLGQNIESTLGRLFAIAVDDTPDFPAGTPSIKVCPKWGGHAFLYALPVPRANLVRHKLAKRVRFMLHIGELERLKTMIVDRMRVFKAFHEQIRADELWYRKLDLIQARASHTIHEDILHEIDTEDIQDLENVSVKSKIPQPAKLRDQRQLPRIHYLDRNPPWQDVRLLMKLPADPHPAQYLYRTHFAEGVRAIKNHLRLR
ncbi:hypothetical protein HWV62_27019 [Athelia sp. TMB]|nr:hypothetical protein HWV62_27019 [Athelia sp. TMB]